MAATRPVAFPARPVIEAIRPLVDGGRFPAKAVIGDAVTVEADVFADGTDLLHCWVTFRHDSEEGWATVPMEPLPNDRWRARFPVTRLGQYHFVIRADIDRFATWRRDLWARAGAGQDVGVELVTGADLLRAAADQARKSDRRMLASAADCLRRASTAGGLGAALPDDTGTALPDDLGTDGRTVAGLLGSEVLAEVARRHRPSQSTATSSSCPIVVDPERARFGSWYELFPRSASPGPGRAGTLADVVARLPYLERLGIDVLYLPPVHPIGATNRKGPDGATEAGPGDPGSPWAIGSADGGHTAVHPDLGTLADVDALVAAAAGSGISVAVDLAFQCSPDHPWVGEHPEWFAHRPDGSIRFAENPPKRYEDIYPLDFESASWWELWQELLGVVRFWIDHGITVFRVDNPHTKPFAFWEWLIATVKASRPEVIFLAEAFTRPKVMYRLAKIGFSQSYTYFAWRNTKWELESYLADLAEVGDFFRPNFWPNTPDILTEALQTGGTATFVARLVLASTLAASYGIYGPPFELQEHVPRFAGSEEYAGSEKYEVRHWDLDRPDSLADLVGRVNEVRRAHPALQRDDTLRVHATDNDQLIAYSKTADGDTVLVVVNIDPTFRQSGWVDLGPLGVRDGETIVVHDLLTGARYRWQGGWNFVILDPNAVPAHVFAVERELA